MGAMESLAQRAALLRESLQKSQQATDAVVSILGSFDSRLSALDSAMRPIQVRFLSQSVISIRARACLLEPSTDAVALWPQVRTHAVRTAHENIDRTLRSADVILTQFDRTREVLATNFNSMFAAPFHTICVPLAQHTWNCRLIYLRSRDRAVR